jgi:hypothetical protein
MPDVSGASAVNTGVHTHYQYARTRLRVHWAPGIPRALCLQKGESIKAKLGRLRVAGLERVSGVEWRHCEKRSDEAIYASSGRCDLDCVASLAMTF